MPAKKLRVEVSDTDGNRYTVTLEGEVTRKKALCVLDIVELLGSVRNKGENTDLHKASKFERVKSIISSKFPVSWFSSKVVLIEYRHAFNDPISLSTVSTYLARMNNRGFLISKGSSSNKKYRIITEIVQNASAVQREHM
ncbi:MAG: hypothetical protein NWE78_04890 [Candidatus Bathyarchaeota archaeon]|nr:hypothetical protein [Candidatus Bathyarchaeota archaeon]